MSENRFDFAVIRNLVSRVHCTAYSSGCQDNDEQVSDKRSKDQAKLAREALAHAFEAIDQLEQIMASGNGKVLGCLESGNEDLVRAQVDINHNAPLTPHGQEMLSKVAQQAKTAYEMQELAKEVCSKRQLEQAKE